MIEHFGWLKSFSGFWKAAFDRLALWVSKRKPKLYVHFQPGTCLGCIARHADAEYMQIVCPVSITHDDVKHDLIIVDVYPAGTISQVSAMQDIVIPANTMAKEQIVSIAGPVIANKGESWTGRIVLVDQFLRKYKSPKATFKWAGPNPVEPLPSTR